MGQDEKGKPTKHPYNPLNPQWKAKNSDSKTWNTFAKALEVASTDGFNGPGFVFSEKDPYTGIDLDKCRDPEIKEIEEWAANIIYELNSYSEISPSGLGIHIFVKGKLPPSGRKSGKIELYDKLRFFTVTGNHLPGLPLEIKPRQRQLDVLH